MNGMKAKAARKRLAAKFNEHGLPVDANDWTVEDWIDLHTALELAYKKIATRHEKESGVCWYCKKRHPPQNWCEQKRAAWEKSK